MTMPDIDSLTFVETTPDRLVGHYSNWNDVSEVRAVHYADAFPERDDVEIVDFVMQTTELSFALPNKSGLRGHFAHPRVVAAFDDSDKLAGYAYGANNASSHLPSVLGMAEEQAKLHIPVGPLLDARYLWIREIIGDDATLLAGLTARLMNGFKETQSVSLYPYAEEQGPLLPALKGTILHLDKAVKPEPIEAFGEGSKKATQLRYTAGHAGRVTRKIVQKHDAEDVLEAINARITVDTGTYRQGESVFFDDNSV
jgi:hypothetical protein